MNKFDDYEWDESPEDVEIESGNFDPHLLERSQAKWDRAHLEYGILDDDALLDAMLRIERVEDDYSPERWTERESDDGSLHYGGDGIVLPELTIYQLTGCGWVVMSDMQTPILVKKIIDHRLPRLRVSSMTLDEATQYINESWDLCDRGFVQIEDHVVWNHWEGESDTIVYLGTLGNLLKNHRSLLRGISKYERCIHNVQYRHCFVCRHLLEGDE